MIVFKNIQLNNMTLFAIWQNIYFVVQITFISVNMFNVIINAINIIDDYKLYKNKNVLRMFEILFKYNS